MLSVAQSIARSPADVLSAAQNAASGESTIPSASLDLAGRYSAVVPSL